MAKELAVFALISDDAVRDSFEVLAQSHDIPVRTYASPAAFLRDLPSMDRGYALIDLDAAGEASAAFLEQLREQGLRLPAIIPTVDPAASRLNRTDATIVEKPFAIARLIAILKDVADEA